MRAIWTDRHFLLFSVVALLIATTHPVLAQKGGAPSAGGTASGAGSAGNVGTTGPTGPTGSTSRGTLNSIPNSTLGSTNNNNNNGLNPRPIFLSGRVMFDDGSQPSPDIRIERVCGGSPHLEAHVDSKGRFSFQVGQNGMVDTDAADDTTSGFGRPNGQFSSSNSSGLSNQSRVDPLWNCELRASYPGYRSDTVNLANRRSLDDPELGTIVLHRLANVQGTTISVTSALAPRHAQKDYEKGMQLVQKGKFEEAEKRLLEATDAYPKYAVAWFALGELRQRGGNVDGARKSYESAIAADAKYVSPYDRLALLSAQEGKWSEAADFSKQVIRLNPVEFPAAFWYNAIANYNLKKLEEAETSAQELVKLDTAHKFPDAEKMLAQILLERGNRPEAATHLRAYLALVPNAKDADSLKQALMRLEQANAAQAKQ